MEVSKLKQSYLVSGNLIFSMMQRYMKKQPLKTFNNMEPNM